jgi:hypothetical protein
MTRVEDDYTGPRADALGCPPPDVLIALAGDALPENLRVPVEAHLARCAACQALAADVNALDVDVPSALDARVLGQASKGASWWKGALLPMAAVLVAAVGLSLWYRSVSPEQTTVAGRTAAPAPAADAPATQASPTGTWEVRKPALLLPLATALVVRGGEEAATRELGEALVPYRTDDYTEAEGRLESLVGRSPGAADAWFYLGATRLLDGDAAGARDALTEARTRGVGDRDDEAAWLLATAEARLGEIDAARAKLTALCDGSGDFKRAACHAKQTLAP